MEKKMEPEQQENSFSRNPKVRDYLNSYNKEDLIASAIELDIEIDGLSKEELAEKHYRKSFESGNHEGDFSSGR